MAEAETYNRLINKFDMLLLSATDYAFAESAESRHFLKQKSDEISTELKQLFSTSGNAIDLIIRVAAVDNDATLMYKQRTKLMQYKALLVEFMQL